MTVSFSAVTQTTGEITIICQGWSNPIVPQVATGYRILIADVNGNTMMQTAEFELDASAYTPNELLSAGTPDSIFIITSPNVRTPTTYQIEFKPKVYIEVVDTANRVAGCYVKLTIPRELEVEGGAMTVLGDDLMKDIAGGNSPTIVE